MTFEEKVRRLAITAIFMIDSLLDRIVFKGGNALDFVYGLTGRTSIDLDFSLCDDFSEKEIPEIRIAIEGALEKSFEPENLKIFDVKL
jgi:predicted nucleotidyltransferase component of viral defense system